ncbi:uncharacterized protein LOC102804282 [Saccoglossus kowalevskii]
MLLDFSLNELTDHQKKALTRYIFLTLNNRPANLTRNIKTPESSISSSDHGNTLSPWEQWLVSKEKEDRLKVKKAMKIEEEKQRQEEEKKKEKEELLKKASGKYKEWSEQKTIQQKVRTKNELRKKRIEEEMQKEEKRKIEEKATEKFQEWTEKKKEAEKERKRKEKEKQAKKEEEEKERRLKAEEKYNEWKDQAKNRPKPQRSSFGYTMGTLTGYYDAGAYPIPSYYNPVPWQPTEVPKSKSSRVKTSRKPRSAKSKKNSVVSEPQSQVKYKTKALQDNLTIWGKHK